MRWRNVPPMVALAVLGLGHRLSTMLWMALAPAVGGGARSMKKLRCGQRQTMASFTGANI